MNRPSHPNAEDATDPVGTQRLDKWLWFARVVRTRTASAELVSRGKVQINGVKITKPGHVVKLDEVVTVILQEKLRLLRVAGFAERRGNAEAAATLFVDLTPRPTAPTPETSHEPKQGQRDAGSGRPTKRQRRDLDRLKFQST